MADRISLEDVIARDISAEAYLERYMGAWAEWVDGDVIRMSAASSKHVLICSYLLVLLQTYFDEMPIGVVMPAPFGMRLHTAPSIREPDLQVILKDNPHEMTDSHLVGAADICIEVVSEESIRRDYEIKFHEYEQGGVREYWIMDPLRESCSFYRLGDEGKYTLQTVSETYQTPLLPKLKMRLSTLRQEPLPTPKMIVQQVETMLAEA